MEQKQPSAAKAAPFRKIAAQIVSAEMVGAHILPERLDQPYVMKMEGG